VIYRNIGALIGNQQPVTLPPTATVMEAARIMAERRVGAVAVMSDSELVGLFTERDLLNRVVAAGRSPEDLTIESVMTPSPVTIGEGQSLADALDIMFGNRFRHLPVLNEAGRLIGVMSCRDIPAAYQFLRERFIAARGELQSAA
jgi:CBS domain-containing protein